jgi:HSP20 family protein
MADNRNQDRQSTSGGTQMQRRASTPTVGSFVMSPFSLVGQLMEDMERMFDAFGAGRGVARGGRSRSFLSSAWTPATEAFEKDGQFVVRADLPGLSPDDVRIEASDDAIVIEGERKSEVETEERGVYRSERVYGRFSRTVPLPEGVQVDAARARFDNGVLEISLPLTQEASRRRRIEIEGASQSQTRPQDAGAEKNDPAVH